MNRQRASGGWWIEPALMAALAAIPCLLMARALADGAIPWFMDPAMYFYPLRVHAARIVAEGEWPLWNRCLMGGVPLWANPQAAMAYPLHWPSLLWPGGFWFTFPQLLQLGLYGALTHWVVRRAGTGRAAALFAGAAALAGSYGWSRLQFGNYLNVLPWWPLWLGAATAFARRPAAHWAAAGVAAVAMPVLGGAHQPAAYGLVGLALIAAAMLALDRERRGRWAGFTMLSFSFGVLIAAPGWLPQMDFLAETSRGAGLDPERVLTGTVGSLGQLARSLVGSWDPLINPESAPEWADAEGQAAIGVMALVLALVPAVAGMRRRLWLAVWAAALVTLTLSLRPVNAALLAITPRFGLFHDPRRILGVTQWLLLVAAGLGADRLLAAAAARGRVVAAVLGIVLSAGIAFQGWWTWRVTDLAMVPARDLTEPAERPLILEANLRRGQRFFVIDWQRAASYDFRRPDLADWPLPNLGMLWGLESLDGYEPAQSRRWRKWFERPGGDAWRRLWPEHFSLVNAPWEADALAGANVRAAVMPRWGVPALARAMGPRQVAVALPPIGGTLHAAALLVDGDGVAVELRETPSGAAELFELPEPLGAAHDLALTTASIARAEPPGTGRLWAARTTLRGAAGEAPVQIVSLSGTPGGAAPQLIDLFCWGDALEALWRPLATRSVAALFAFEGQARRYTSEDDRVDVTGERISHNAVEIGVHVADGGGELVVGDAWWPGWRAELADGTPVPLEPAGPWRRLTLPEGRHIVRMVYCPPGWRVSWVLAGLGVVMLLVCSFAIRRRSLRGTPS